MKKLELDFHYRPRISLSGLILLLGGLLACILVVFELIEVQLSLGEEGAVLARVEAALPQSGLSDRRAGGTAEGAAPAERETIEGAQAVAGRLAIPWGELLATIARADDDGVAVTALSPDADNRTIRIEAQARDLRAMLDYNARLAASPLLADVALSSHELVLDDPEQPVRFSLTAVWRQSNARNQ